MYTYEYFCTLSPEQFDTFEQKSIWNAEHEFMLRETMYTHPAIQDMHETMCTHPCIQDTHEIMHTHPSIQRVCEIDANSQDLHTCAHGMHIQIH
jgi:hypothetical protein